MEDLYKIFEKEIKENGKIFDKNYKFSDFLENYFEVENIKENYEKRSVLCVPFLIKK